MFDHESVKAIEAYRNRTGMSADVSMLAVQLETIGENFHSLEPMAMLLRIKELEARVKLL